MSEATNVIINYWYNNGSQTKHYKKGRGQKNDKYEEKNDNVTALALMTDGRFYCCGKVGHKSP